jgi:hypothetical protein
MKNLLIVISALMLLVGCNQDKSLSKKVPGWYSYEQKIDKGNISGKLTYYKNGALKLTATIKGELVQSINIGIDLTATGNWKVENGYLKEDIVEFKTIPQSIGDALLAEYKKDAQTSPGDKIIHVNKEELQVKTAKGETVTYKRLQQ